MSSTALGELRGCSLRVHLCGAPPPLLTSFSSFRFVSFDLWLLAFRSSQAEVFEAVGAPLVDAVLRGVNGCLIAYGQTGAGKTFTTFGPVASGSAPRRGALAPSAPADTSSLGLIPRSVHALFDALDLKVSANRAELLSARGRAGGAPLPSRYSFAVSVTYYQIYLDSLIQDLLEPGKGTLSIRQNDAEDASGHYVEGLSSHRVTNVTEVVELLERGDRNKVVSHTAMNATSSRSHSIFTVHLVQQWSPQLAVGVVGGSPVPGAGTGAGASTGTAPGTALGTAPGTGSGTGTAPVTVELHAKLTCVDLAGSERASRTQPQGLQLEEAKSINRSLSALGNVIAALSGNGGHVSSSASVASGGAASSVASDGHGEAHASASADGSQGNLEAGFVPWRDSKLTRVLQDCLGGQAQVSLVINVGPGAANVAESINSLLFGRRSMQVSLEPAVNVRVNQGEVVRQLQAALERGNAESRARVSALEDRLLAKSSELESLRLALGGDKGAVARLQRRAEAAEARLAAEQAKSAALADTHALLEEALLEQLEINTAIERRLREDRAAAAESVQSAARAADAGASASARGEAALEERVRSLTEEVIRLTERARGREEELADEQQRSDELQVMLEEARAHLPAMTERLRQSEERCAELEARRAADLELSERAGQLLGAMTDERVRDSRERAELHEALGAARTRATDLEASVAIEAAAGRARLEALEQRATGLQATAELDAAEAARRVAELEAALVQRDAAAGEAEGKLRAKVRSLRQRLAEAQAEAQTAGAGLLEEQRRTRRASTELSEQDEAAAAAAEEGLAREAMAQAEVHGLRAQCAAAEAALAEARDELDSARHAAVASQSGREALTRELAELRASAADREAAAFSRGGAALLERLVTAEAKLDSLARLQLEERQLFEDLLLESSAAAFEDGEEAAAAAQTGATPRSLASYPPPPPPPPSLPPVPQLGSPGARAKHLRERQLRERHELERQLGERGAHEPSGGANAEPSRSPQRAGAALLLAEDDSAEALSSPRLKLALQRSKQALARAMEAINDV